VVSSGEILCPSYVDAMSILCGCYVDDTGITDIDRDAMMNMNLAQSNMLSSLLVGPMCESKLSKYLDTLLIYYAKPYHAYSAIRVICARY
jgi:hypothetical protein